MREESGTRGEGDEDEGEGGKGRKKPACMVLVPRTSIGCATTLSYGEDLCFLLVLVGPLEILINLSLAKI